MGGRRDPRTHAMTHSTLQCGEGRETDGLCLEWTAVGRDCESLLLRNCLFCLVVWGLRRGAGQQLPTLCCYYISHGAAAIVHFVAIKFYILKYYSHLIWISSELTKYVPPTDLVNWRDINILAEYCARYSKYLTVVTGSVHTVGWWIRPTSVICSVQPRETDWPPLRETETLSCKQSVDNNKKYKSCPGWIHSPCSPCARLQLGTRKKTS